MPVSFLWYIFIKSYNQNILIYSDWVLLFFIRIDEINVHKNKEKQNPFQADKITYITIFF